MNKKLQKIKKHGPPIDTSGVDRNLFQGREYVREAVRQRDNYQCVLCRKEWNEGERRFDVHHLDSCGEKSRGYDSIWETQRLVTMCHKCHMRYGHNNHGNNKLTEQDEKQIQSRLSEGEHWNDIAEDYPCTGQNIYQRFVHS